MKPPLMTTTTRTRRLGNLVACLLLALATSALVSACGSGTSVRHDLLIVAGSTSVQPFAEKLGEMYMAVHPRHVINVQGGGSSAGIMAVLSGAAQIGTSSRELTAEERRQVVEYPMAWDGIAVVVNCRNPVAKLSLAEINAIFAGRVTNWKQLGLPLDHRIDAISREEGSGTRSAFEELVMAKKTVSDSCLVQDSNGAVRELVATDPYAIGYISVGLVDARVNVLAVDGILPTAKNIKSRTYRLVRPFLFCTRGRAQGEAKAFIGFVLGHSGQSVLEAEGLVGVGPAPWGTDSGTPIMD
ncbi:MAG: phosphate ABC transporter substrate-binding protein [Pseudomonadota bacterium]